MKFLLLLRNNPAVLEALTEDERTGLMEGHGEFIKAIQESGELIVTQALADPANSVAVRAHGGAPVVTDGPYLEAKEVLGGYYLVDCASQARAVELATMIPDARIDGLGVEVRQVMFSAGLEM